MTPYGNKYTFDKSAMNSMNDELIYKEKVFSGILTLFLADAVVCYMDTIKRNVIPVVLTMR